MIFIIHQFIEQHIHSFTKEDLRYFANQYSFSYTEDELQIVYSFLKEHYKQLLNQDIHVFEIIRNQISPDLYKRLLEVYIDLKQKYL